MSPRLKNEGDGAKNRLFIKPRMFSFAALQGGSICYWMQIHYFQQERK